MKGIAIAGTIAVDTIKRVKGFPKKSELSSITSVQQSIGGAVSNCSVALSKIDKKLPIEIVTLIGNDERGNFIRRYFRRFKNISMDNVQYIGETPFTDVISDEVDNSRTFFTYKGNSVLFDEQVLKIENLKSDILHVAYLLLLDALDQEDEKYGTKLAKLLKEAQDSGIKTSIDIVSENSDRYKKVVPPSLKFTNYCVINEIEAGRTVGIDLRNLNGELRTNRMKEVLDQLKRFGVKDWVIIHSPEGSFGYDGNQYYSIPSLLIEKRLIKGTVGAGDAYVSGILYGALNGFSIEHSMEIATAAAASSLLAEDSTSGIKSYEELILMYQEVPKRSKMDI